MEILHVLKKTFIVFLSFFGALTLIEAGIRLADWYRGSDPFARAYWYWGFEQDRFLGYRPAANIKFRLSSGNYFDTNSAGFRDREMAIQSPTPRRLIICMGESNTWGTGSYNLETTWPKYLEKILQSHNRDFVVLNAGVTGYTTVENLQLLSLRLLKYQPEAIIYMGFRNDFISYVNTLSELIDFDFYRRPFAPIARSGFTDFWMHSTIVSLFMTRFRNRARLDGRGFALAREINTLYPPLINKRVSERGKALLYDNIALMSELAKRHQIQFLWADQVIQSSSQHPIENLRKELNIQVHQLKIPFLEVNSLYDRTKFPMLDDVHLSEQGNQHLAELIAPQLLSRLRSQPSRDKKSL